jgi:hypothetical protein
MRCETFYNGRGAPELSGSMTVASSFGTALTIPSAPGIAPISEPISTLSMEFVAQYFIISLRHKRVKPRSKSNSPGV